MFPHEKNGHETADERLSAYFDGEISPDERDAVEKLLVESASTRHELDEIAQLSALLHSIPRESSPVDLVSLVRSETDKLPLTRVAPGKTAAPVRSLRREWMAAGLASTLTAASLLLMVNLSERGGSDSSRSGLNNRLLLPAPADADSLAAGSSVATQFPEQLASSMESNQLDSGLEMSPKPRSLNGIPQEPSPPPSEFGSPQRRAAISVDSKLGRTPHIARFGLGSEQKMDEPSATKTVPAGSDGMSVAASESQRKEIADDNSGLSNAVVLDTLTNILIPENSTKPITINNSDFVNGLKQGALLQPAIQVADNYNNVGVVDLTVVDIERGLNQTKLLLERNSIPLRLSKHGEQASAQDKTSDGKNAVDGNSHQQGELIVVYVVAPGEQVANMLQDMEKHPDLFKSWSSQPPVQLAEEFEVNSDGLVDSPANLARKKASSVEGRNQPSTGMKQKADAATADVPESAEEDILAAEATMAVNALFARGNTGNNYFGNTALVSNGDLLQRFNYAAASPQQVGGETSRTNSKDNVQLESAQETAGGLEKLADQKRALPATAPARNGSQKQKNLDSSTARQRSSSSRYAAQLNESSRGVAYQTVVRFSDLADTPATALAPLNGPLKQDSATNNINSPTAGLAADSRDKNNSETLRRQAFRGRSLANGQSQYGQSQQRILDRNSDESISDSRDVKLLFVLHPMPEATKASATKQE